MAVISSPTRGRAWHLAGAVLTLLGTPAFAADSSNAPIVLSAPLQLQVAENTGLQPQRSQPTQVAPPAAQQWSVGITGLYSHRQGETTGWAPSLEANYSPNDRLQFHTLMPFTYDQLSGRPMHYGPGDFEIGVRYRVIDDDPEGWRPAVAVYPLVDFPTGDVNRQLGTGSTHAFLPIWFSKTIGAWIPFGGGGYWINPGPFNKDWGFVSLGVIRVISEQLMLTFDTFHATASKVGLKDQTGFDVGARYNLTDNHHFVVSVGRGLENADTTNQFTALVSYVLTF